MKQFSYAMIALVAVFATANDRPCSTPDYSHGISYVLPLKYPADFPHFAYSNPLAPKRGLLRLPDMGTFDNFNGILEKGRIAAGFDFVGSRTLVYDRLLEPAIDEPASQYGRLAEGVAVDPQYRWVAFKLRAGAYWHDGEPLTVEDVLFSFNVFKEHGSVSLRTALQDLVHVYAFGERELCFVTRANAQINPIMPFAYGGLSILPKHYWQSRDISKTTVEAPLGSGPYRLKRVDFGRSLDYERVENYWGRDIPVNRGRYNWNNVKFDYFRDENVMLEAHKADVIDAREETVSKAWTTEYNFPAVKAGLFKADLRYITRVWGLWWPIFWNLDRPRFQDIRVREALWLLYDFSWINRVILFGFYDHGTSFFHNSPMAQAGLPDPAELKLLEPFRDQLPPRVFTTPFKQPPSDGFGTNRDNIVRALELLSEAGWELRNAELRHKDTNQRFTIDFVFVSPMLRRAEMPYVSQLNQIGIKTTAIAPENSHWQHRMRTGTFDGGAYLYIPSNTPGLDLRNRFGSLAAGQDFSLNWAGIKDPIVDALIEKVIQSRTADDLYASTRALDRVLLWSFYFIPGMAQPGYRLVHWDKFGEVETSPLSRVPVLDAWWWDENKAQRVAKGLKSLNSAK